MVLRSCSGLELNTERVGSAMMPTELRFESAVTPATPSGCDNSQVWLPAHQAQNLYAGVKCM